MNHTKSAILIGAGALIIGAVFASVPREDRAAQWPALGGLVAAGALVGAIIMRKEHLPDPKTGLTIDPPGGIVIPFRRTDFKPSARMNDISGGNAQIIPFPRVA